MSECRDSYSPKNLCTYTHLYALQRYRSASKLRDCNWVFLVCIFFLFNIIEILMENAASLEGTEYSFNGIKKIRSNQNFLNYNIIWLFYAYKVIAWVARNLSQPVGNFIHLSDEGPFWEIGMSDFTTSQTATAKRSAINLSSYIGIVKKRARSPFYDFFLLFNWKLYFLIFVKLPKSSKFQHILPDSDNSTFGDFAADHRINLTTHYLRAKT